MSQIREVKRQSWLSGQTSGTSGTVSRGVFDRVDGLGLSEIDELLLYLQVTSALVGGGATMDIYLQRALVPNPSPTTDAHWEDMYAFTQVAVGTTPEEVTLLPILAVASARELATWGWTRETATQAAAEAKVGHWGDRIRVVEKVASATTGAVYSLHATGVKKR